MTAITHGFWKRRSMVARIPVASLVTCRPASDDEVRRALELAASKVDANAGEELTSRARNIVIARAMPKAVLSDPRLGHFVELGQFYMAMREIDPEGLNAAHRQGSVPPLLAVTRDDDTVLREVLVILLLLKDFDFIDENTGRTPDKGDKVRPAFVAGSYHVVTPEGTCIPGAGRGIHGSVGCILHILEATGGGIELDFVRGTRETFKRDPPEREFQDAVCF